MGRSVTGAVDADGDGEDDIVLGAQREAWFIPGRGPKTLGGGSKLDGNRPKDPVSVSSPRTVGERDARSDLGAVVFKPAAREDLQGLVVGPAGDVDADGVEDFVIAADGRAEVFLGLAAPPLGLDDTMLPGGEL